MTNTSSSLADNFSLHNYLEKYFRKKWLFIFFLICSLATAILYLWFKTPLYQIQATLVIKDEKKGESNSETLKQLDFLDEQKIVDNEAEILKSKSIISAVVERMALNISYYAKTPYLKSIPLFYDSPLEFKPIGTYLSDDAEPLDIKLVSAGNYQLAGENNVHKFGDTVRNDNGRFIILATKPFSQNNKYSEVRIKIVPNDVVMQDIKKGIIVSTPTKNSSIINISMLHPSPQKGSAILLEIVKEYNKSNIEEKRNQTDSILQLIEDRITFVSTQLNNAETQEESFKSSRSITTLSDDSKMFLEKIKENDKLISETNIQLEILSSLDGYLNNSIAIPAAPAISDRNLLSLVNNLSQLEIEKQALAITTGNQNPLFIAKVAQINEVKKTISNNLALQKANLKSTLSQLMANKKAIDNNIGAVPGNEMNLVKIMREKSIRENIYLFLLQKREEASIADASVFSKMRIIDNPYSSKKPVKPNKIVVLLSALLVAFLIPAIIINLLGSLNNKVVSRKMIEEKLGIPVIGEIAKMKNFEYVVIGKSKSIYAEQFRRIRTHIDRIKKADTALCILVTSCNNNEGKTFVSFNLALGFSMVQKKTILVDFDFAYPNLHTLAGLEENSNFNRYLTGETNDPSKLPIPHPQMKYFDIIPCAVVQKKAGEQLGRSLDDLFIFLKNNYDIIILNTLPFRIFSEPLQLEKYCDISVFNIRHQYTTLKSLEYLGDTLNKNEFKNPLIVYNDVPLNDLYDDDILKNKHFNN
jgi:tyrosine-protein kinase Etk/Wzc